MSLLDQVHFIVVIVLDGGVVELGARQLSLVQDVRVVFLVVSARRQSCLLVLLKDRAGYVVIVRELYVVHHFLHVIVFSLQLLHFLVSVFVYLLAYCRRAEERRVNLPVEGGYPPKSDCAGVNACVRVILPVGGTCV